MRLMYNQNQIVVYDDGRDMSERKDFFSDGSLDYKGHSVKMNQVRRNDKYKQETCLLLAKSEINIGVTLRVMFLWISPNGGIRNVLNGLRSLVILIELNLI